MDFAFSEEEQAVADLAKQVFKGLSPPSRLAAVEATEDGLDHDLWRNLGKAELLGCALAADSGGSELGFLALCQLIEQAGRQVARVPLIECMVMAAMPIDRFGTPEQRALLLPVTRGEGYLTAALSELGDDVTTPPATTARLTPHGWALRGTKIAVPLGPAAARILVPASTPDGVAVFLLDPKAAGVSLRHELTADLEHVYTLSLEDVAVTPADRLGQDGDEVLDWTLDRARTALAAHALGLAHEALILTAKYTSQRQQFDRPIATFQAVSQRAADACIDVEAMRLTTWQAAWRLTHELPARRAVAIAKYWAAEGAHRVTFAAQHLHGGMGFDRDYPLWRYTVRAKRLELTLGPAAAHLADLGRQLAEGHQDRAAEAQ